MSSSNVNALFDAVIIGSGFSGSILGQILTRAGWRIAIVDRAKHPRFAIGESSTPTADFLLAYLADRWRMPELRPLAAWGTWKETYPKIDCGKKRGFTYFAHSINEHFQDDPEHSRSLMVAASQSDHWSDTHWLRSDVDAFLADQCVASGCLLLEDKRIDHVHRDGMTWRLRISNQRDATEIQEIKSRWLIDAGGGGDFSEGWLGNKRDDHWMKTQTRSVFGHFRNVGRFSQTLCPGTPVDPSAGFDADDSAQHHVTQDGWMWMLRFDSGVTSVGIVQPNSQWKNIESQSDATLFWNQWIDKYPSIRRLLAESDSVLGSPDSLRWGNRLSRCRQRAVGDGWVQLPTAYGFVDPLHSSGIAHALSGVQRIAEMLIADGSIDRSTSPRWVEYDRQLRSEIEWIDLLVGGCYKSLPSFVSFCGFAAWYFVAAIQFERGMACDPSRWIDGFLSSENENLRAEVLRSFEQLPGQSESKNISSIRRAIAKWNDVGLLEPTTGQRIPHTAPPKYSCNLVGMP